MTDKISVIMPAHNVVSKTINGELAVEEAIKSFLMQTGVEKELIIVDDNSSDDTYAILQAIKSKLDVNNEIIISRNQWNMGAGGSRNKGISIASGAWIMFLDADDAFTDGAIAALYRKQQEWQVDFITGNVTGENRAPSDRPFRNGDVPRADLEKNNLTGPLGPWGKLFSKAIIDQYELTYPSHLNFQEDLIFVLSYFDKVDSFGIAVRPEFHYVLRKLDDESQHLTRREVSLEDRLLAVDETLRGVSANNIRMQALALGRLLAIRQYQMAFGTTWRDFAKQGQFLIQLTRILQKHHAEDFYRAIPDRKIRQQIKYLLNLEDFDDLIKMTQSMA